MSESEHDDDGQGPEELSGEEREELAQAGRLEQTEQEEDEDS